MAEDLPRIPPARDEADRRLRAMLGIIAGGETGARFAGTLGFPGVEQAIREGAKEANPDLVTTGEVVSPAVWPAILGNAASEIGTGIQNWWTGYDKDKPILKSKDDYIRELSKPVPTLAEYKAAAQEKVRNSPAYNKLLDERRNTAAARLIDQAGKDAELTYAKDKSAIEAANQAIPQQYEQTYIPGYNTELEKYYARGFGERNPGLGTALPVLGTLGAMAFTRGRFKGMANQAKEAKTALEAAKAADDPVALAAARQAADKLPGRGEKIATGLAGVALPFEAQLAQDIIDKHRVPPEYRTAGEDGKWMPSKAYERASRNLDPSQDFWKTAAIPLASGALAGFAGYKAAPKMVKPPEALSADQIKLATGEISAGLKAQKEIADLKADLSRPAPNTTQSVLSNAEVLPPIPPAISKKALTPSRPKSPSAAQSQDGVPSYGPPQNQKSKQIVREILESGEELPSVSELTNRVRAGIGSTKTPNKSLTARAQGSLDEADFLRSIGVDIYNPAIRDALVNRIAPGTRNMLSITGAAGAGALGAGAMDQPPEQFASGGAVLPRLGASGEPVHVGPLMSDVPGRTDHLNISVPEGAFVLPADIVSGLGEGNTAAGMKQVAAMFPAAKMKMASGGAVPIAAAGGEFVLSPEQVAAVGGGDLARGHEALDNFVVSTRQQLIQHLARLPRPEN
jgi:hypothetical protein